MQAHASNQLNEMSTQQQQRNTDIEMNTTARNQFSSVPPPPASQAQQQHHQQQQQQRHHHPFSSVVPSAAQQQALHRNKWYSSPTTTGAPIPTTSVRSSSNYENRVERNMRVNMLQQDQQQQQHSHLQFDRYGGRLPSSVAPRQYPPPPGTGHPQPHQMPPLQPTAAAAEATAAFNHRQATTAASTPPPPPPPTTSAATFGRVKEQKVAPVTDEQRLRTAIITTTPSRHHQNNNNSKLKVNHTPRDHPYRHPLQQRNTQQPPRMAPHKAPPPVTAGPPPPPATQQHQQNQSHTAMVTGTNGYSAGYQFNHHQISKSVGDALRLVALDPEEEHLLSGSDNEEDTRVPLQHDQYSQQYYNHNYAGQMSRIYSRPHAPHQSQPHTPMRHPISSSSLHHPYYSSIPNGSLTANAGVKPLTRQQQQQQVGSHNSTKAPSTATTSQYDFYSTKPTTTTTTMLPVGASAAMPTSARAGHQLPSWNGDVHSYTTPNLMNSGGDGAVATTSKAGKSSAAPKSKHRKTSTASSTQDQAGSSRSSKSPASVANGSPNERNNGAEPLNRRKCPVPDCPLIFEVSSFSCFFPVCFPDFLVLYTFFNVYLVSIPCKRYVRRRHI